MIDNIRAAEAKLNIDCRVLMDIAGPKCRIALSRRAGEIPTAARRTAAYRAQARRRPRPARKSPSSFPKIINQLEVGAEVFFDDGKAAARVTALDEDGAETPGLRLARKGRASESGQGAEFPLHRGRAADVDRQGFPRSRFRRRTRRPRRLLVRAARRATSKCCRTNSPRAGASQPPQAIVLKIETPLAIRNLPKLILQSLAHNPDGGDDRARRSRGRDRLRAAVGNAGGDPLAVRSRAHAGRFGRPRCSTSTCATGWRAARK